MNDWIAIAAFALIATLVPVGMVAASWLIRPSVPEPGKRTVFESGEIPTGSTRIRFNIQYYMVALLFVVFDIETVLLFPWALVYTDAIEQVGLMRALVPMLGFVAILLMGLLWAWRNGAVTWAASPRAKREGEHTP